MISVIKLIYKQSFRKASAHPEEESFVCKLQKGRDKFMTTTFKSVAILREGNSATKPCEAGLHSDTRGVTENHQQRWNWLHNLVLKETWSFSMSVLQTQGSALLDEAIRDQKGYSGITLRDRRRRFCPNRTEVLV